MMCFHTILSVVQHVLISGMPLISYRKEKVEEEMQFQRCRRYRDCEDGKSRSHRKH